MLGKPTRDPIKSLIRLDGKTAVITGAARGIGAAAAYRFAEAGADPVLVEASSYITGALIPVDGGFLSS
jgi:hypothetical protein